MNETQTLRAPRRSSILVLAGLATAPWVAAQQDEGAGNTPLPRVPVIATDPPLARAPATLPIDEPGTRSGLDGGVVTLLPATYDDDTVPLPNPPRHQETPEGDVLVAPASGNPFFLGFAAGPYYPEEHERLDPTLLDRLRQQRPDGRGGRFTYAFAMFARRMRTSDLDELEDLGVRILGPHPHYVLKVAVPVDRVELVAKHPAIRWLGVPRTWQKIAPELESTLQASSSADRFQLYVSVFESDRNAASVPTPIGRVSEADPGLPETIRHGEEYVPKTWTSHGWQQHALEELGVRVEAYVDEIAAFRVDVDVATIGRLLELDFVQYVEPDPEVRAAHDESTPLIHADRARASYDGSTNQVAIVGLLDSGYDRLHFGLNHTFAVSWDFVGNGFWLDDCPHGSHVAGTILGDPPAGQDGYTGVAPGLGFSSTARFRTARFLSWNGSRCAWVAGVPLSSLLATMRNSYTDSNGNVSPRPHAVNNSWGSSTAGIWRGTEANARAIDAEVYDEDQLYVFAAGNTGPGASTIWSPASAKNAFTAGLVLDYRLAAEGDPGTVYSRSSRGPMADGRWKPNVVAPGRWVRSVTAHSTDQYNDGWGTSMAAPHVTGVAAQLVDHYSFLRYRPARLASLMMATATTRNDASHNTPATANHNLEGAGRVSARRAGFTDAQHGWLNWGFTQSGSNWAFGDFTVQPGCERIVVCMTYHEPAASSGASRALVKDIDLYIDRDPISSAGNVGEYVLQQSSVDNTEIRTINAPAVGPWRWKTWPITSTGTAKVSVTVHFIYGDTTPSGTLTVVADDEYVQPNEAVRVTATATNPSFVASGVFLDSTVTSSGRELLASSTTLKDGIVTDLMSNQHGGYDVLLGDILYNSSRTARWDVRWSTEGSKTWSVNARSDNWTNRTASATVVVDGTAPSLVTNLRSTTHTINAWSNDPNITYAWTQATDNLAGVQGYGLFTSNSSNGAPSNTIDILNVSSTSETLATHALGWYFKMKTVDRSGNWTGGYAWTGPYRIDTVDPGAVSNLVSSTHNTGVWSNDPNVGFAWTAATDLHAGIDGYGLFVSTGGPGTPSQTRDIGAVVHHQETLSSHGSGRWFNLRSVDRAGNWDGDVVSVGPFLIDTVPPSVTLDIEGGQANVPSLGVTLDVAASDAHSGLSRMRFQNDGGAWSPWEPYAPQRVWNLTRFGGSSAPGLRTVRAEVMDRAGNVRGTTDRVVYYIPVRMFGRPCAGSLGLPTFDVQGLPGIGETLTLVPGNTAATSGTLFLGFSNTSWLGVPLPADLAVVGSPSCFLHVSPDVPYFSGAPGPVDLPLPNDPSLVGFRGYAQWMLFGDPSGVPVITTAAAEITLNQL